MIIPKKITIGDTTYKIKRRFRIDWDNKLVEGQINYSRSEMLIKRNINERGKEDTFFHEVAHGILKELEFNYPRVVRFRTNEKFVQELGLILRKTFLELLKKQEAK